MPPPASGLTFTGHIGINRTDDGLLTWRMPESTRLLRYDVLFSKTAEGPFIPLNPEPLISAIYLHADRAQKGFYRIRTVSLGGDTTESTEILAA